MFKLDAYATLTEMAKACQNDDTAKENPFLLAIGTEDGVEVHGCCHSGNIKVLVESVISGYVNTMKDTGESVEKVAAFLAMACATAMAKHYDEEIDDKKMETAKKEILVDNLINGLRSKFLKEEDE